MATSCGTHGRRSINTKNIDSREVKPDPVQTANDRFAQGFNCAQAVFSAFASQYGITDESALKLSSPFGGGFARQGQVCGALTGALMILGLAQGNDDPQGRENTYQVAQIFINKFKACHGAILCHDLIGHDISTPTGLKAARDGKLFETICPSLVRETAKLLSDHL